MTVAVVPTSFPCWPSHNGIPACHSPAVPLSIHLTGFKLLTASLIHPAPDPPLTLDEFARGLGHPSSCASYRGLLLPQCWVGTHPHPSCITPYPCMPIPLATCHKPLCSILLPRMHASSRCRTHALLVSHCRHTRSLSHLPNNIHLPNRNLTLTPEPRQADSALLTNIL